MLVSYGGGLIANVTVYVDQNGETVSFRLYECSEARDTSLYPTINSQSGGTQGSPASPVQLVSPSRDFCAYITVGKAVEQQVGGDFVLLGYGVQVHVQPPSGEKLTEVSIASPAGGDAIALTIKDGGNRAHGALEYETLAQLQAGVPAGVYTVQISTDTSTRRALAQELTLLTYAESDLPSPSVVLAPVPDATGVSTTPTLQFTDTDWWVVSLDKEETGDEDVFLALNDSTPLASSVDVVPALELDTDYSLWLHRRKPLGAGGDAYTAVETVTYFRTVGNTYTLTVNSSGATGVSISSTTGHGGTTDYQRVSLPSGSPVNLTAPSTSGGKEFSSWSGAVSSSTRTIDFAMDGDKTITANYAGSPLPFVETFDGLAVGESPQGWDNLGDAAVTVEVVDEVFQGTTGRCLYFSDTITSGGALIRRSFSQADCVVLEYYMCTHNRSYEGPFLCLVGDAGADYRAVFGAGSYIGIQGDLRWEETELLTYELDTWYYVRRTLDCRSNSGTFYVEEVGNPDHHAEYSIGSYAGDTYIDQVKIFTSGGQRADAHVDSIRIDRGTVATPVASPGDGTLFAGSLDVSLACTTSGASVWYTTDGSQPVDGEPSLEYSSPVHMNKTTTLKARAFRDGMVDSETLVATYTRTYSLTVENGSGDGSYAEGTVVPVTADAAPDGQHFAGWTVEPTAYASSLVDSNAPSTTFTIPASDVTLRASYNAVPEAMDDSYCMMRDGSLSVGAPGVLGNDTDAEGDALAATKLTDPAHGTLELAADGSFAYTPASGYVGVDSFTYTVSDSTGGSDVGTARVAVAGAFSGQTYLVVDLSGGASALVYPTMGLESLPDSLPTDCRTTKLVLRRIPAGTFTMGTPDGEPGRETDEDQHQVTLTEDFYIGVFEVTQKQWELVMGSNPSTSPLGDAHPVESVSYNAIRGSDLGAQWPASDAVDQDSFVGRLRARAGVHLDLPTEARWEYSCRAGTTRAYNDHTRNGGEGSDCLTTGTGTDANLDPLAVYHANSPGSHAAVGTKQANAWGLYDMHGNIRELCLDRYVGHLGTEPVVDPLGGTTGTAHPVHGGGWNRIAVYCRSGYRSYGESTDDYPDFGFRLAASVSYALEVQYGTGEGDYARNAVVEIVADEAPTGQEFAGWTVEPEDYAANLADASASSTTFTMPAAAVTLTATYTEPDADTLVLTIDDVVVAVGQKAVVTVRYDYVKRGDSGGFGGAGFSFTLDSSIAAADPASFGVGQGEFSNLDPTQIATGMTQTAGGRYDVYVNPVFGQALLTASKSGVFATFEIEINPGADPVNDDFVLSGENGYAFDAKGDFINPTIVSGIVDVVDLFMATVVNGSGSGEYLAGAQVVIMASPPPEGQEFAGWTVDPEDYADNLEDSGISATTFTMPADDVTITAAYAIRTYTVTFDLEAHGTRTGGGELTQVVPHGSPAIAPEFTVETGWGFTGWSTTFDGVTSDLTVTAQYREVHALTVTNGSGDGSYAEGTPVAVVADAAPSGQEFAGWVVDPSDYEGALLNANSENTTFTMPGAAVTLTANYVVKTYAVTFDLGTHGTHTGGGDLTQTVTHGTAAAVPLVQVAIGWLFTGWNVPFDSVTADLTVTACYEEEKLEVVPVVLAVASTTDKSALLPTGIEQTAVGDTFVVEFWARNADGSDKWLTVGGIDLEYSTSFVGSATSDLFHGGTYNTLTQGTADDAVGRIDEFGGGVPVGFEDAELGTTHWARIGGAQFTGNDEGTVTFSLLAATTIQWFRKGTGGTEPLEWANISLGNAELSVVSDPRTPDPSGDGLCNLIDYGYFLGCYGEASGTGAWLPNGPKCDYNRDGTVNLIDYGYFLGFYGRPEGEWVLPAGTRGGWRETRLQVAAVAVAAQSASDKLASLPTALASAEVGGTFVVELWARNTDGSPSWISVGGVDVSYTTSFTDVGGLNHGGFYTNLTQGTIDDAAGLVDEFGGGVPAGTSDSEMGTTHWARLGYFFVTATGTGTATFAPGPATTALFFRNDPFGMIDWSSVEFASASLEVVLPTRTVTYKPGLHGTLEGGSPDVVVTVDDGAAAPIPPTVTTSEGWTHTGWDWQAVTRGNAPETITQDWTVTAVYEEVFAAPVWSVSLALGGASPEVLTFGMHADATDGWDPGLDEDFPLPGPGQACLAADDLSISYSTEYRAPAGTAEFLFVASAGEEAITVSWDVSGMPADKFLTIYEVLIEDIAPSRAPVERAFVGNTALRMVQGGTIQIPAGEVRCYVIRYGGIVVYDLALTSGWNLISLPIEPLDPAADTVLDDGLGRASGDALRDGLRGTVHSGSVWAWEEQAYVEVTALHACVGYWVFADSPSVILVEGTPVEQNALDLLRGWNLCGPAKLLPVPDDARIRGRVWTWNAETLRYQAGGHLWPGRGHWINVGEDATIPLEDER